MTTTPTTEELRQKYRSMGNNDRRILDAVCQTFPMFYDCTLEPTAPIRRLIDKELIFFPRRGWEVHPTAAGLEMWKAWRA